MVEVGVGQPDPPEVERVDDGLQCGHEFVAFDGGSCVDEHRFAAVSTSTGSLPWSTNALMGTTPNPGIGEFDVITSMSGAAVR